MNYKSIQINENDDFENGWGFYVDIETTFSINNKYEFLKEKYIKNNYNNSYHKIDEELEYYEYEYNKKKEDESKQEALKELEDVDIIKTNSSSLLFHISSLTVITAALSYCFLVAL